jgi:hypothetical protein
VSKRMSDTTSGDFSVSLNRVDGLLRPQYQIQARLTDPGDPLIDPASTPA